MMGYGETATQGAVSAGDSYATRAGQASVAQGDARASGVAGMTGAGLGLLNSLGTWYGSRGKTGGTGNYAYNGLDPSLIGF